MGQTLKELIMKYTITLLIAAILSLGGLTNADAASPSRDFCGLGHDLHEGIHDVHHGVHRAFHHLHHGIHHVFHKIHNHLP